MYEALNDIKRFIKENWLSAVVYLFVVAVILRLFQRQFGWAGGDMSGWVQAIGSIAAIVGSFWIGQLQSKSAVKQAHESERRHRDATVRSCVSVVGAAFEHLKTMGEMAEKNAPRLAFEVYWRGLAGREELSAVAETLRQLPLSNLGSSELVVQGAALGARLYRVIQILDDELSGRHVGVFLDLKTIESIRMNVAVGKLAWESFCKAAHELISVGD